VHVAGAAFTVQMSILTSNSNSKAMRSCFYFCSFDT